jgi:hypothetical protein
MERDSYVVARRNDEARCAFRRLKGSDGGLPDSPLPECKRKLYAVIGFQPPKCGEASVYFAVGRLRVLDAGDPDRRGFNLGYCKAKPGKGR